MGLAFEARRFVPDGRGGVCEGVEKRSFLTAAATKPSGKKHRFPTDDGDEKRLHKPKQRMDTNVGVLFNPRK
jgi:hypothetical protein